MNELFPVLEKISVLFLSNFVFAKRENQNCSIICEENNMFEISDFQDFQDFNLFFFLKIVSSNRSMNVFIYFIGMIF